VVKENSMTDIASDDHWKPTQKQSKFLSIPFSVLEAFYAGAVYAGKTDVLLMYPIVHRMHEDSRFRGLFLRRTFPELNLEVVPRSKRFFLRFGAKYNQQEKVWRFPSGALFFFGHIENEDDVHRYDSTQLNYCAFDELTSFTEWQYLYLTLQRVRTIKGSNLPAIVRSASNPGNTGHNWVKKRFIDPAPAGHKILRSKGGIKRIFIPATIDDNPYADPNYRKSLESIPNRAEREAKLYGKWDSFEGQVFEEFRDRRYPDEPEHALHVIDSFEIPKFWPRVLAIDWGYAALTYACYGAIAPNKRIYIYKERFWSKTKIEEWAAYLQEDIKSENFRVIKICKSAGQDRGQENTILQQVSDALGQPVSLANSSHGSRVAGKALLHEYLRWKPKYIPNTELPVYDENYAQWIMRNRGLLEYKTYIEMFKLPEPETNLPKLQIFKECALLIETIKACVYDKTKIEDVAEFSGDDPYDALRYLLDSCSVFFDEAQSEFEKVRMQQAIIERLQHNNDYTAFYRNMRHIEAQSNIKPVSRYHGSRR
jgi:hypothetical protein